MKTVNASQAMFYLRQRGASVEANHEEKRYRIIVSGERVAMISREGWLSLCAKKCLTATQISSQGDWRYELKRLKEVKPAVRA